jgi:Fe2+ transport system protein FeoA
MSAKKITLLELKPKTKARVKEIIGGTGIHNRLTAMGVYAGCEIEKKSSIFGGPVIVKVCRSVVAIGRGMAGKIIVETNDQKM